MPLVLANYKEDDRVRCASPIFKPIAYKLGSTKGKRKYDVEKITTNFKCKQTSIATVRNHLRTLASITTPLIFHWSLPLKQIGIAESIAPLLLKLAMPTRGCKQSDNDPIISHGYHLDIGGTRGKFTSGVIDTVGAP